MLYEVITGKSINERVVSLHLLEDVLGWIAILIGAVVILLWDVITSYSIHYTKLYEYCFYKYEWYRTKYDYRCNAYLKRDVRCCL